MNHFQLDYPQRLQAWRDLRETAQQQSGVEQLATIDQWWQHAPLVNNVLHPYDQQNWPDPWELLANNQYCTVARALGMCYTISLCGNNNLELALASDDHGYDHVLVLVDNAKYILNCWPGTVLNNILSNFTVQDRIDIQNTLKRIR